MNFQDGYFTNQHNQSIYYQAWLPDKQARFISIIVHGLHDHSGRYQHLAEFLTSNDIAVYGCDQVGHGKSIGTRSFVKRFSVFTDTLLDLIKQIQGRHPDLPLFLIGHSMGGLISSAFLIDYGGMVNGAVLSGSLVMVPDYITDLTISLGQVISSVMPKMRLVGIDSEDLSRDPSVVRAYQEDPLVYNGKATARISAEINKGIAQIAERGAAITCPVLILHGGADRVVNPHSSRYLFDLVSSTDKEIVIYEGYFHEVYNEPGKEKVFQDVLSWLNKHIP